MRPTVGLSLCVLALALTMPSCARFNLFRRTETAPGCGGPAVGTKTTEIDGETFDGRRLKLSEQKGKIVVVVFWFSKCPPCRAMIPHEREIYRRYQGEPVILLGVNADANLDDARKIIDEKKMVWPIFKPGDGEKSISQQWGIRCYPAVFVIDAKGIVRYSGVTGDSLDSAIDSLLSEMKKAH
jgi:thiol-disulfide isomerase/thioredoxin